MILKSLQVLEQLPTLPTTKVVVLIDKHGKKCLVRQDVRTDLVWHLSVARNKLGAIVADSVGIPANYVEIIPAHVDFPGKFNRAYPLAYIHSYLECW